MPTIAPIHPGEILREEFLRPLDISGYRLAQVTGLPQTAIGNIVHERRGITARVALRLARALRTTPEFWMNLQATYELEVEKDAAQADVSRIEPLVAY